MNNNEFKNKVSEMVLSEPKLIESLKVLCEELSRVEPAKEQRPDMIYVLTQKVKAITNTGEEIYHYHPLVGECLLLPGAEKNQMVCSANLLELQALKKNTMLGAVCTTCDNFQILAMKPDEFELLQFLLDETVTALIDNTHKAVEALLQNDLYTGAKTISFEKIYETIMRDLMNKAKCTFGSALNSDSSIVEKIDDVKYEYQPDCRYCCDDEDDFDEDGDDEPEETYMVFRKVN